MMGAIGDILGKFGDDTVQIIRDNLASTGTNASGRTSQSLRSESTENRVIVSGKAFIYVVETGRRPGRQPPVGEIAKWIVAKPAAIQTTVEDAAWAISKTIAKHGSKLFREGGRDDIITPAVSDERFDMLTKEIADAVFLQTIKGIEDATSDN